MVSRPAVYVTREIPEAGLDMLEADYEVHTWEKKLPPSKERIITSLQELEADALLCLLTDNIDAEVLDASDSLEVVSTCSVGYDHIDLDAAAERGIDVGHTPGVLTETTADLAWSLMMTCARRTIEGHHYVREGRWETWQPTLLTGQDVHDTTLGIVGLGNIGTAVARRGAGFGMDVIYSSRSRKPETEAELENHGVDIEYVDRDVVFECSDFISLHVPLTKETEGLVSTVEFERMKEDAVLINTSRGEVVDTDALIQALDSGEIKRAGLDVTDPEPLPGDHPLLNLAPERVVVLPHLGSASVGTRDKMARMAAENIVAGLHGEELPNSALADAGYDIRT
ncbi:D-glycerate dehydrogenase [Halostella sp. JP-L12]|uniref:2-hydroxyacid dehydrogenase n=1 Tax=Halostella TaxID=1843185 RepID=UPI000EF82F09|nr:MULTISPECIES: D-glycerate dehydrogenase [Halostella]NHN49359.1 D-glycerate dehydrogenase [Halostella sp. JP-L12]